MSLSQKQIVIVTGKGGVGKSTVAATLALSEAQKGRKTLLVELGEESFYKLFFDLPELSYRPQLISAQIPNLSVAKWDVEHCLREYVLHFLKVERLYSIFFENRVMRTFINAAPAISELAILGKVTSNHRKHGPPMPFDLVVVDAHATGHFLALLRAPKGLSEAVRSGPFGEQSASIMNALMNPEVTEFVIVTLAEILPVTETEELWSNLKNEFGVEASIICNRILNAPVNDETLNALASDPAIKASHTFLTYLQFVFQRQKESLLRLTKIPSPTTLIHQSLDHLKGLSLVQQLSKEFNDTP